jgi:hypothetical protein
MDVGGRIGGPQKQIRNDPKPSQGNDSIVEEEPARDLEFKSTVPKDSVESIRPGGGEDRASVPILPIPNWANSRAKEPIVEQPESQMDSEEELDAVPPSLEYWGATNPPPNIHVGMEKSYKESWVKVCKKDAEFKKIWKRIAVAKDEWKPGERLFRSDEGLRFFRDADYQPRLCVPHSKIPEVLAEAHEMPMGSAHASPERLCPSSAQNSTGNA